MEKIEILAPAGNQEALAAAVESGADAVYLGGSRFNARAFAGNFDDGALENAVRYAHIRGGRIYITVNILLSDHELIEVIDYVRFLYYIGVDAVIVQDLALLKLVKSLFPELDVHCSTQMTVHNSEGARYLAGLGADRIIIARELSVPEIREIVKKSGVGIEAFVHGALCVSYSGQCLMSSLIGGRSGNRGKCAQPCRRRYTLCGLDSEKPVGSYGGRYLLSTRDLNTYHRLEEIAASGVRSLKIEGRMKKPEYVAIVVKHYKEAMDHILGTGGHRPRQEAADELKSAFNREFTEGYLFGKRNRDIVSTERPDNRGVPLGEVISRKGNMVTLRLDADGLNDGDGIEITGRDGRSGGALISGIKRGGEAVKRAEKGQTVEIFYKDRAEPGARVNKTLDSALEKKAREDYFPENKRKLHINARAAIRTGEYPMLELTDQDGNFVRYVGEERIEKAEKAGTPEAKLAEQLKKTGDTPYEIKDMEITADRDCFVPAKLANRMRREALKLLSDKRADKWYREVLQVDPVAAVRNQCIHGENGGETAKKPEFIAGVRDYASAEKAVEAGIDALYYFNSWNGETKNGTEQKLTELAEENGRKLYFVLPSISKDHELAAIEKKLDRLHDLRRGAVGIVVSNVGQLYLMERYDVRRYRMNYTLNAFNAVAVSHWAGKGAESVCLSPELSLMQIEALAKQCAVPLESVVYGYLPVMTTEYCPLSLQSGNCGENRLCLKGQYGIKDERGMVFPLVRTEGCRTQILNSRRLLLADDLSRIIKGGVGRLRMDFWIERPEEVFEVVRLYGKYNALDGADKRKLDGIKEKGFTKGHFFRGV